MPHMVCVSADERSSEGEVWARQQRAVLGLKARGNPLRLLRQHTSDRDSLGLNDTEMD